MPDPAALTRQAFDDLLSSDAVTPQTREALRERQAKPATVTPSFFDETEFHLLKAVCARLIPQEGNGTQIDLAGMLDEKLCSGPGKGWRYDTLPEDATLFHSGIEGISQSAHLLFGKPFEEISEAQQDEVLTAIQEGKAPGETWARIPPERFFEELLAAVSESYYSHPEAKRMMDDRSFADAHGWDRIGLQPPEDPAAR